jgi:hypothetical protein
MRDTILTSLGGGSTRSLGDDAPGDDATLSKFHERVIGTQTRRRYPRSTMRFFLRAIAICLVLSPFAGTRAVNLLDLPGDTVAGTPAPAAAPAPVKPSGTAMGANADGDAAAKHAKRTACLKNAKAKKLVGAQKTAFVKDCIGAP